MNTTKDNWVIDRPMTDVKEREILFLTAEAAGLSIYDGTRRHLDIEEFPYLYCPSFWVCHICGIKSIGNLDHQKVSYEQVLENLRKIVKEKSIFKLYDDNV